jgi:2-aminoadipate transaminase
LVIHVSSASKIVGGGLRLGWLVAPPAMIDQLATLKRAADLHTNNLAQVAFQRFLAQGLVETHLATLRQVCQRRAGIMLAGLRQHLPELMVQPPRGGLYLWSRLPDGLSAEAVLEEAHARGVTFMPGSWHSVNGCDDGHLRLCYTAPPLELLDEAVVRLAAAVRAVANRGAPSRLEQLNSQPAVV